MKEITSSVTPWHRELKILQDSTGSFYLKVVDSLYQKSISACLTEDNLTELRDALNRALEPQLFYLHLIEGDAHAFINLVTADGSINLDDKREWCGHQTRFTAEEIESNPALKKFETFKVPVEEVDA
ncbi:hypothetical protein [Enterococcus entomosocium]|uniref:hypothetical protein n=1 Tax=Enterococcus entomosocium TaxID=3034352 RepID=UPI0026482C49|nr:hypothetical protein [Enterococcus entomosocium]